MSEHQANILMGQLHAVAIFLKDHGHDEHADIVEQGVIYIEENEARMNEARDALRAVKREANNE